MATATRVSSRIGTGKRLHCVCPATARQSRSSARSAPRQPASRGARSPTGTSVVAALGGRCPGGSRS